MDNIELIRLELVTSDRDAIRKAREAFLISEGKTLKPDETWSTYFLIFLSISLLLSTNHVTYIFFSII